MAHDMTLCNTVPQTPTGFNVTQIYPTETNQTLTLEWDLPQDMVRVDYYIVTVTPQPLSHPISNEVMSPPWNVTVEFNIIYISTITAVNCAGPSGTFTLTGVEQGT